MKLLLVPVMALLIAAAMGSCGSAGKPKPFCDTTGCNGAPLLFTGAFADSPFVKIPLNGCQADSIIWGHRAMENYRGQTFAELVGKEALLNAKCATAYFNDTSYAWLKFNDCVTGRGYLLKLPFNKTGKMSIYTSALNNFDPKFSVQDGLIAYYSGTDIYVQDEATGDVQSASFADSEQDYKYDKVHDNFDSVNITRERIWAKVKVKGSFKEVEKKIKL